ncbi:MAG: hypothetical protein E5W28_09045 [Mesorhizobium sp.]|nr:MAG: hypothetical protein E5W28_09045 [Mesorhizobium sp.]
MSLFRDAVTGLADRLEREANLDARQVDCASQCGDELLYQLHKKVEDFFNSRPEEHRLKTDLFNQ